MPGTSASFAPHVLHLDEQKELAKRVAAEERKSVVEEHEDWNDVNLS